MHLDNRELARVAELARIAIAADEAEPLRAEIERVLTLVGQLQLAALDVVEPMAHPIGLALALRADTVVDMDAVAGVLALAPAAQGGLYLVPKVIE